jgi:hypothetical protein
MKLAWLVSVPVIAVFALFAVRSAPTLAGPSCADQCAAVTADQTLPGSSTATTTLSSGMSIYTQVSGQYCSDKSGGQIFINTGADTTGLTCPAGGESMAGMAMGTATATATKAAASSSATPAASGTSAPAASSTPSAASTAAATATATAGSH